ncbi:GAF and ANTAR domain-containing protein [Amycolatopsis nigrescens]|uniref:GAF and ANTAR domain-containing protein n=1 Tax=Amycolatopsis nigrescens TaxID=381445 RepID=UPI0003807DF0|nr:GAF and ANTAR domain-containing protein [Amycolatopsis nigrescens]
MTEAVRSSRWILDVPENLSVAELRTANAADAPVALARSFADLAHHLYGRQSGEQVIDAVLAYSVTGLTGCDHAGVSLVRRGGRISTPATTDDRAAKLDELQYTLREGPCVQAIWDERSFSVPDLAADPRWPKYGPAAAARGARSMLAFQLFTDKRTLGALNLYSGSVRGFTDEDEQFGLLLAAHAAVALDAARTRTELRAAIESRQVIGEALGILKERHHLTSEDAFTTLTEASQRLNIKLRDLAEKVSTTGEDPATITS